VAANAYLKHFMLTPNFHSGPHGLLISAATNLMKASTGGPS